MLLDLALSYGAHASLDAWKANWSVIPLLVYLEGVSWHDLPFPGDKFNLLLTAGTLFCVFTVIIEVSVIQHIWNVFFS